MNIIKRFLIDITIVCSLLFVACAKEEISSFTGQLTIQLADGDGDTVDSRALPEISSEMIGQFLLTMRNVDKDLLTFNDVLAVFNEKPRLFAEANYSLQARYGKNETLAMNAPYYKSDVESITVKAGEEKEVKLACYVANSLAAFEFVNQHSLDKVLKEYYIEIAVSNQNLKWYPNNATHPYFKAGSEVLFTLKGTSIESGKPYSYKFASIQSVTAGKLYRYKLAVDTNNESGAILDVQVDTSVEVVTINQTLPPEWLPKPKVNSNDFDEQNMIMYTETANALPAAISLTASRAIQEVELDLNFADSKLSQLNKKYSLSTLSEEERNALKKAGISVPVLDGFLSDAKLDFTEATTNMLTNHGGQEVLNEIKLKVKANNRWSDEVSYVIKTVKPKFQVRVYPGDVWTMEFTKQPITELDVEKPANLHRFGEITYEFSEDALTWSNLKTDTKDNLTPGSVYYVRAKYRGEVTSQVTTVRTYEQLAIPNANLNGGYDTSFPKKNNPLYTFKGGWIGTRNPLTCNTSGGNFFYVSKSGTLPVTENGSTVAHMMTLGWGEGNTCNFGNKSGSVIKNISAGMVCVGDYNESTDEVSPKEAYARPTSLSFVYKAAPYNGDEYLVEVYLENLTDGKYTTIGKATLQSGMSKSTYTEEELAIVYDENYRNLPISHLRIEFKSGTKSDRDHLEDEFRDNRFPYGSAYIIGSQFWLDSFTLNYDR